MKDNVNAMKKMIGISAETTASPRRRPPLSKQPTMRAWKKGGPGAGEGALRQPRLSLSK